MIASNLFRSLCSCLFLLFFLSLRLFIENPKDWSDHALWWPSRNIWLLHTRSTLDQCGVHADALLHFTPMHKVLRVQMPDLRPLDCRVDFSAKTFKAVVKLCKDLGIRHPEELSFCKQLESQHLKKNYSSFPKTKFQANEYENSREYIAPAPDTNSFIPTHSSLLTASNGSLDSPHGPFSCAPYPPPMQLSQRQINPIGSPTGVSDICHLTKQFPS